MSARLEHLIAQLRQFVADRDWSRFHDPKNLAMLLASEAGELLAELRWVATSEADAFTRSPSDRDRIEQEVGDIAIALLLFCERTGIDLLGAAERKLAINEANYPAEQSRGRSERPVARSGSTPSKTLSRTIAIDWSGSASGGHDTIWLAEVVDGEIVTLENGRSRAEVIERVVAMANDDPSLAVGLDFAFSFPRWFAEKCGVTTAHELWATVAREGELWLQKCESPFWGRPGIARPELAEHFRRTDVVVGRQGGGQAKSVFQIGGAGAVGTGSIRGMPHLLRLHRAGFAIWPFDEPGLPLAVEIYPRLLTGPVIKSNPSARVAFLDERFPELATDVRERAASTEDAFDAAVSSLAMWEHKSELAQLPPAADRIDQLEGRIWSPALSPVSSSS